MAYDYEKFKAAVLTLTRIDLNDIDGDVVIYEAENVKVERINIALHL